MSSPSRQMSGRFGLGLAYALGANLVWGLSPIYFKLLSHVPAIEILAHRVLWSVPILLALSLVMKGGWRGVRAALGGRGRGPTYLLCTLLVSFNWGLFIWGVGAKRVMEVSLGYYISPLVMVVLALLFLRERLSLLQQIAVGMAACGVAVLAIGAGTVPIVSFLLALSWSTYALIRTKAGVDPLVGLLVETTMMAPVAATYLAWIHGNDGGAWGAAGLDQDLLLAAAGVVTVVPLMLFMNATRHVAFSTVGLLGYLAPTLQLLIAIVYGEPFTLWHGIAFASIWSGLAVYSADAWKRQRARTQAALAAAE
ncbi:MAG TPA: EamA family transporter RarD [Azospirillaceae bacterium]|nr:EamA family transporter RarD [Azospirillaceae bacterium]